MWMPWAWVGLLASAVPGVPDVEGVQVTQQVHEYVVTGNTARRMLEQMQAHAVANASDGHPLFARLEFAFAWSTRYATRDQRMCWLDRVDVTLGLEITLPSWQPIGPTTPALRRQWLEFREALLEHELQHRALALQAAREVRQALHDLPPDSCDSLQSRANAAANAVLDRTAQANRDYDARTRHGQTEGAVWHLQTFE